MPREPFLSNYAPQIMFQTRFTGADLTDDYMALVGLFQSTSGRVQPRTDCCSSTLSQNLIARKLDHRAELFILTPALALILEIRSLFSSCRAKLSAV